MLLSMTGHGSAMAQDDQVQVLVEVRSVNNRFLKISVSGDSDADLQSKIEGMIRDRVQRGAINVRTQIQFLGADSLFQINIPQLKAYQEQLSSNGDQTDSVASLLTLPGVITESMSESKLETVWPTVETAIKQAIDRFVEMRDCEGAAMLKDLLANCDSLEQHIGEVKGLVPNAVDTYSTRVTERINRMLVEHDITVSPGDLIREVGVFADKVDTSEELVRLASHIDQFRKIANGDKSNGRKLDFLTQELLRETNTIGSKANDAQIASHVVEMKTIIERIREMIQNVE